MYIFVQDQKLYPCLFLSNFRPNGNYPLRQNFLSKVTIFICLDSGVCSTFVKFSYQQTHISEWWIKDRKPLSPEWRQFTYVARDMRLARTGRLRISGTIRWYFLKLTKTHLNKSAILENVRSFLFPFPKKVYSVICDTFLAKAYH